MDGRVAVVTGGASGIGRACVERFAADGTSVVIVDLDDAAAEGLASTIGHTALALSADVTDEAQVAGIVERAQERFGRLDVWVNNAGRGGFAPILSASVAEWRAIHDVCLTAVFTGTKHAARAMVEGGRGGRIVNVASLNAVQPAQGLSAYCAAKAGVAMFTQVAAMELGVHGITVNAVAPGLIETPLAAGLHTDPAMRAEFLENQAVDHLGQPADIADAVAFLCAESSGYVTGDLLHVDGGARTGRYPRLFDRYGAAGR